MFTFEALAAGYFVVLGLMTPFTAATRRRMSRTIVIAAALDILILLEVQTAPLWVRMWSAHVYLVAAYWIPALLVARPPSPALETWLMRTEASWRRYRIECAGWLSTVLETAYLFCYPLVPIAFTIVWTGGNSVQIDRFWIAVLGAGFVCYGSLPWLVSRPPRSVRVMSSRTRKPDAIRNFNLLVLGHLSHGRNTFPSGHVAVSVAAALVVGSISLPAGIVLGLVAAGISCGAVVGGYHYLVDVLIGAAVGATAAVLASHV